MSIVIRSATYYKILFNIDRSERSSFVVNFEKRINFQSRWCYHVNYWVKFTFLSFLLTAFLSFSMCHSSDRHAFATCESMLIRQIIKWGWTDATEQMNIKEKKTIHTLSQHKKSFVFKWSRKMCCWFLLILGCFDIIAY